MAYFVIHHIFLLVIVLSGELIDQISQQAQEVIILNNYHFKIRSCEAAIKKVLGREFYQKVLL